MRRCGAAACCTLASRVIVTHVGVRAREQKATMQKREEGEVPDFLFRASTRDNCSTQGPGATRVHLSLPKFARPVVAPLVEALVEPDQSQLVVAAVDTSKKVIAVRVRACRSERPGGVGGRRSG
jgi:hypothetical protein